MIAKLNTTNIYDGCLSELRDQLTDNLPSGQDWYTKRLGYKVNGIKNLVGTEEPINEHNNPYDKPPAYYQIFYGNNYIQPISYSLMGRRSKEYKRNYISGWDLYGQRRNGDWLLLSSFQNSTFEFGEIRIFPLNIRESFRGFMINLTEPDTEGKWCLCAGQIEIHGYIFDKYRVIGASIFYSFWQRLSFGIFFIHFFIYIDKHE